MEIQEDQSKQWWTGVRRDESRYTFSAGGHDQESLLLLHLLVAKRLLVPDTHTHTHFMLTYASCQDGSTIAFALPLELSIVPTMQ